MRNTLPNFYQNSPIDGEPDHEYNNVQQRQQNGRQATSSAG